MGNYVGGSSSTLETEPVLVKCKCDTKATYRFGIKVPLEASQKSFVKTYFALKRYSSGVYQSREIFLGCEKCVSEEDKQYFTYHPEGWTVGVCPASDFEDLCSEAKASPREHELVKENALLEITPS